MYDDHLVTWDSMNTEEMTDIVKAHYSKVAKANKSCCGSCDCASGPEDIGKRIGYSDEDLANVPEANLGLGCGNPLALGQIKPGDTVLDLGSGAGFDCFLASRRVGESGHVIGVDMTDEMLDKARGNAAKHGITNVEFRKGYIHRLPVVDSSIDVIISNCVINLAPDKKEVFNEAFRVLRSGGRLFISDIVLLAELTPEQRNDPDLIGGCIGGAILKDDYLAAIRDAGFHIHETNEARDIGTVQYGGLPVMSLKLSAIKI